MPNGMEVAAQIMKIRSC